MRYESVDERMGRFSIVDTQEHVSAEIRRQPQPENGCLNWRSLAADLGIFLLLEHFDWHRDEG